jgi:hypothetical protein
VEKTSPVAAAAADTAPTLLCGNPVSTPLTVSLPDASVSGPAIRSGGPIGIVGRGLPIGVYLGVGTADDAQDGIGTLAANVVGDLAPGLTSVSTTRPTTIRASTPAAEASPQRSQRRRGRRVGYMILGLTF